MTVAEERMGAVEAILARKSVRRFLPQPVAPEVLREVLGAARFAPSWENTQPWEVIALSGQRLQTIKDAVGARFQAGDAPHFDITASRYPDHYRERSKENGLRLFGLLGIMREDRDKRQRYMLGIHRFFEAPAGLLFLLESDLPQWALLDLGLFLQSVMICAVSHGLGSCVTAAAVAYPEVLRELLAIPESKRIICGLAVGYPDESAEINQFRSHRVPLDEFVRWCGDENVENA